MITTALDAAALTAGRRNAGQPFFRYWMPYLYQRIEHPKRKHVFLPLGRNYKPLGHTGTKFVEYAELATAHGVAFQRDPATFVDVWWNVSGDSFWLYDDSAKSRFTYFDRLERLLLKANTLLAMEKTA